MLDLKAWFRAQIAPYLSVIKAQLEAASDITGQLTGVSDTFNGLPTTDRDGSDLEAGDWAILSAVDGSNVSGIYVYDGSIWVFAMAMASFQDMVSSIIASNSEASAGLSEDKAMSVKHVTDNFAKKAGDDSQAFEVGAAATGSNQAVRASQFNSTAISSTEASSDWSGA